ncbi:unnamed protein product [Rodentolepis nana]|uniref:NAC domain-containing protein n=1 Tax=Rodentolepis nana TaxID=102285 RepID=A0A0R3T566_RODNA|nr:unnamed protein product [Rodentolepis nana]
MNESVGPQVSPFFGVKEIGHTPLYGCPPNMYQQYVFGESHFEIPQFYSDEEVIRYMVPNSPDNRFLILYPYNGNIHLNRTSDRCFDSDTKSVQIQTDIQATDFADSPEAPTEVIKNQHPGFILLSVKHEKVGEDPQPTRKSSSDHKGSGVPMRKISRKRTRKMTPISHNSGTLLVNGFGFISPEEASRLTSNMTKQSSSFSRFRVTRIADVSSWWIPNNSSMNISVHDLKTPSLPDFVTKQYQKLKSDVSYNSHKPTE